MHGCGPPTGSAVEPFLFLYGLPDMVDCLLTSVFVHALLPLLSLLLVKAQTQTVAYVGQLGYYNQMVVWDLNQIVVYVRLHQIASSLCS